MFNAKIEKLAFAIKTAEGWLPKKNSLTYRNHNPGALRSSMLAIGTRDNFAYFLNDEIGFAALCYDLAQKCRGNTITMLRPTSALHELIRIYTAETNPAKLENYIRVVEQITGMSRHARLEDFK